MKDSLIPPYKKYVKTETGKVVKTTHIDDIIIKNDEPYIVWEEIYYGTVAYFKERVVDTADTMEELLSPIAKVKRYY